MSRRGHFKQGPKVLAGCLPVEAWPGPDLALWERAKRAGSVLKAGGRASRWRPRTIANVQTAYSQWLFWAKNQPGDLLALDPAGRVTRERVDQYLDSLPAEFSGSSVQMRLQRLGQMMGAFTDSAEFNWLFRAANRLKPKSVRNKRARMQPTYRLAELGFNLMQEAQGMPVCWRSPPAAKYRNGLIIALLSYAPVRRANLAAIEIGRHLIDLGGAYRLAFAGHETKQGAELVIDLPPALTEPVRTYLEVYRPALLRSGAHQGSAGNRFWVSRDGGALGGEGIYGAVKRETRAAFGKSINLHLFRDCAATTIAVDDPAHAHVIAAVLGHSSMTTSENHYNQAGSIEAGRQYDDILKAKRAALGRLSREFRGPTRKPTSTVPHA